jgi:hypothetical protein
MSHNQTAPDDSLKPSTPDAAPTGALLSREQARQIKPKEKKFDGDFKDWLEGLLKEIAKDGEAHQRAKAQLRAYNEIMYLGGRASFGRFVPMGQGWRWQPDQNNARLYPNNRFAFFVNNLKAQAESSVTKIRVEPTTEDEEKKGGAKFSDHLAEDGQKRLFTASFRQREWLYAMFSGEAYRLTRWEKEAGCLERVPVPQQAEEQVGGSFMCQCGAEGSEEEATEAGGCPECGQPATIIPGQSVPVTSYSFDRQKTGDFMTASVDPLEMKIERGRDVKTSRYIERRRSVHVDDLEEAYPGIEIPAASGEKSPVLQVKRSLDFLSAFGSSPTGGEENDPKQREYVQDWLQPRTYANFVFDKPCELKCGVTIPAGVRLGQLYPSGMYVATVGGQVFDIQPEFGPDVWDRFEYYTTTCGDGKGVSDAAFLQESYQEAHSIRIDHALRDSLGWGAYNKNLFDGDVAPNTPGMYVPMDLPIDGSVPPRDAIDQFNGNSIQGHAIALPEDIANSMSYAITSFPETAGATSQSGQKTLGGYLSQLEQGTQGQRPMFANRAECDCSTVEKWLKNFQRYATGERYARLEGKFGQAEGRWFKASDVPVDYRVTFEQDSYMPQTGTQKRARRAAFQEAVAGILETLTQMTPEMPLYSMLIAFLKGTAEDFGVSIEEDIGQQDTRRAQLKLEKFKAACEYVGQGGMTVAPDVIPNPVTGQLVPNPQAGQPVPNPEALQAILNLVPYLPAVDGPGAKTQKDFLRSAILAMDDDQEENPLLVAVLVAEMGRLDGADVQTGQQQNAALLAKQAPQMAMQQQQQAQGEQANAQREDQHRAEDAQREAQGREHEFAAAEAQRGHESSMADAQMRHEQQLTMMKPKLGA